MIYRAFGRLFHKELIRYNRPVNFVQHVTSTSVQHLRGIFIFDLWFFIFFLTLTSLIRDDSLYNWFSYKEIVFFHLIKLIGFTNSSLRCRPVLLTLYVYNIYVYIQHRVHLSVQYKIFQHLYISIYLYKKTCKRPFFHSKFQCEILFLHNIDLIHLPKI